MLISGSERSPRLKVVPPLCRSISFAVSGVICINPRAPAADVRSLNFDSA
jgi:hypothetical protein